MNIREFIESYKPCKEARTWLLTQPDIETAWQNCVRPDWMLWALSKLRPLSEVESVNLSCRFVRETPLSDGRFVVDLLTDTRSVAFLEMKEAWVAGGGGPKPEGWNAAEYTAEYAAWEAALDAAWDAAWAAARDTARTAVGAAAGEAAWDAAWAAAHAAQVAIIRSAIPTLA